MKSKDETTVQTITGGGKVISIINGNKEISWSVPNSPIYGTTDNHSTFKLTTH